MRVLQLIPAEGIWWAHFGKKQDSQQVAAWALCEGVEEQGVLAMIVNEKSGSLIPAATQPGFSGVTRLNGPFR